MFSSFAVLCTIVALVKSTKTSCPLLIDKVETVDSCPQTTEEWKEAAARKSCKTTSNTCSSLDYHCVINAWMNETIEVCAPRIVIVGKVCAEFNFGGNRIQRNENATCEKCPEAYNSSDAFMYTECYEYVEKSKGLDTSQSSTETSYLSTHAYTKSSDRDGKLLSTQGQFYHMKNKSSVAGLEARIVIGLSVTATVVTVLIISSVLLLIRRRRIRHQETRNIHVCSAVKRMLLTRCSDICQARQGNLQNDQRSENHLLTSDG